MDSLFFFHVTVEKCDGHGVLQVLPCGHMYVCRVCTRMSRVVSRMHTYVSHWNVYLLHVYLVQKCLSMTGIELFMVFLVCSLCSSCVSFVCFFVCNIRTWSWSCPAICITHVCIMRVCVCVMCVCVCVSCAYVCVHMVHTRNAQRTHKKCVATRICLCVCERVCARTSTPCT